jgi:hypothetical protein
MERREVLRTLAAVGAVPLVAGEGLLAKTREAEIKPEKEYFLFCDPATVDVAQLIDDIRPNCLMWLIPVKPRHGQTIDDAVKLYELGEAPKP